MDTTIGAAIRLAAARLEAASGSPALDAEILLAFALDRPRSWLLAHKRDAFDAIAARRFDTLIQRRADGHPVAYLVGMREFWSRPFRVTPETLIPRPETEHLVETALACLPAGCSREIADLGTGSGIIALTLALERPGCFVTATDISSTALAVARDNAARLGVTNVTFHCGDWFAGLEGRVFDLIASNPPYIASCDPHLEKGDLRHEPPIALSAGATGLEAIRELVSKGCDHLTPGGWLILEHGFDQADAVTTLLAEHDYIDAECVRDIAGHPRVAAARRPGHDR